MDSSIYMRLLAISINKIESLIFFFLFRKAPASSNHRQPGYHQKETDSSWNFEELALDCLLLKESMLSLSPAVLALGYVPTVCTPLE